MRVLAFDTATSATAVAVLDVTGGRFREARDDPPAGARPAHASRLLGLIEQLVDGDWSAIDRLAVGVGPGTFTGPRIGVATAHALARGRGIPLVGVSTLASLALGARASEPERALVALIDARRGEVFAAGWGPGALPGADRPVLEPCVLAPEAVGKLGAVLAGPLAGGLALGDGALRYRERVLEAGLQAASEGSPLHRVSALSHCRLGASLAPGPPDAVQPSYLRVPDAELNLGQ